MEDHSSSSHGNFLKQISSLTSKPYVLSQSSAVPMLEISSNCLNVTQLGTTNVPESSTIQSQDVPSHTHSRQELSTTSTSTYTFLQIKREPCQVSEITTSNNQLQEPTVKEALITDSAATSTLTALVKIESSPSKIESRLNNVSCGITSASLSTMEKSINILLNTILMFCN